MTTRLCCTVLSLGAVPYVALLGQRPAPALEPGARVRVTFPCGAHPLPASGTRSCRSEGRLIAIQGDTLAFARADSTTRLALVTISRVEASHGRRSRWLLGAGLGLLVGAGATYAVLYSGGSTSMCNASANQDAMSSSECFGLTALGGVAGAGLGALLGSRFSSERWQDVPLTRLRLGLGTGPDGRPGIGVALAF
jgi:hypothetical protein